VGCDSEPPNQPMVDVLMGVRVGVLVVVLGVGSFEFGQIVLVAGV
jgi:hypothetical protein